MHCSSILWPWDTLRAMRLWPSHDKSRSEPDFKKLKQKQVCTSHTECVTNLWHLWLSQSVTNLNSRPVFFLVFLAKQVWSYYGHTFNCDRYKPVSVSVSIEMVWNERNMGKHTRKWALFLFFVWNSARNGFNNPLGSRSQPSSLRGKRPDHKLLHPSALRILN